MNGKRIELIKQFGKAKADTRDVCEKCWFGVYQTNFDTESRNKLLVSKGTCSNCGGKNLDVANKTIIGFLEKHNINPDEWCSDAKNPKIFSDVDTTEFMDDSKSAIAPTSKQSYKVLFLTVLVSVALSLGIHFAYEKFYKKIYVVDYTSIINHVKGQIEASINRGDELSASIKMKQFIQIATQTDHFCKTYANQNGIEIYAANLVFAPQNNIVDLTPNLVSFLQSQKLIEGNITNAGQAK